MTNAWDHAANMAKKHANSGGIFIRLASNGDSVIGAFCGEPHPREVVWCGDHYEDFDPEVHTDKGPSLRVMLNFYVPAEGSMKVIEGGTVWTQDVIKLRDKYGLGWLYEIQRHGDAGDPKTKYSILPEEKIDDELRARIEAAPLHDLAGIGNGNASNGRDHATSDSNDGTIPAKAADELIGRLKGLPRSDVDVFLQKLGVQRVRDLKASDEPEARALLDQLDSAMKARTAATQKEIDPFA